MQYRTLGKTALRVSLLSLGGSPLGGVFGPVEERDAIETVHAAIDLGVNFIDTSPYYALTRSEAVLGRALHGIARERYYISTKVGRYGEAEFDFSARRVTASIDESLTRLGVDYVDLIQCHDIEYGSLDQVIEETIPALRRAQDRGKVRFVGITALPLKALRTVVERADVDTVLSYCHYTLYDTSFETILPLLEQQSAGVINAAPMAMGLLTGKPLPAWHPAPDELRTACARAAAYCKEHGRSISRIALQFSAADARIHTVVAGTASPRELKENVESLEERLDLEFVAELQAILASVRNRTWQTGRIGNT